MYPFNAVTNCYKDYMKLTEKCVILGLLVNGVALFLYHGRVVTFSYNLVLAVNRFNAILQLWIRKWFLVYVTTL